MNDFIKNTDCFLYFWKNYLHTHLCCKKHLLGARWTCFCTWGTNQPIFDIGQYLAYFLIYYYIFVPYLSVFKLDTTLLLRIVSPWKEILWGKTSLFALSLISLVFLPSGFAIPSITWALWDSIHKNFDISCHFVNVCLNLWSCMTYVIHSYRHSFLFGMFGICCNAKF